MARSPTLQRTAPPRARKPEGDLEDLEDLEDLKNNLSNLQLNDNPLTPPDHPLPSNLTTTQNSTIIQPEIARHLDVTADDENAIFSQPCMSASHLTNLEWALASLVLINADLQAAKPMYRSPFSVIVDGEDRGGQREEDVLNPTPYALAWLKVERVTSVLEAALRSLTELARMGESVAGDGYRDGRGERGLLVACEMVPEQVGYAMGEITEAMGIRFGFGYSGPI